MQFSGPHIAHFGKPLLFLLFPTLLYLILGYHLFHKSPILAFNDSPTYAQAANFPLLSKHFWASNRPFTTPLIFKLFANQYLSVTHFYLIVSFLAWSSLGLTVWLVAKTAFFKYLSYWLI